MLEAPRLDGNTFFGLHLNLSRKCGKYLATVFFFCFHLHQAKNCDLYDKSAAGRAQCKSGPMWTQYIMSTEKSTEFRKLFENVKNFSKNLARFQHDNIQELLEKEIYAKRFNILIYDVEENLESAWETKWESEKKVRYFFMNV